MVIFFIVTILSWAIAMPILIGLCEANWTAIILSIGLPVVGYIAYHSALLLIMTSITEFIIIWLGIRFILISKRGKR